MTARSIAVVTGGLSQPSSSRLLADRLAAATAAALQARDVQADTAVVELRDHAHDLADNLLTGFASKPLEAAKATVAAADGVIAVTPIFSASYTGLFKDFFDLLDDGAIAATPVVLGATAGTARHSLALEHALRPLFAYLKAVVVPTAVFAASEDWGTGGQAAGGRTDGQVTGGLSARVQRAGRELADLVAAGPPRTVTDPFDDVPTFQQMLDQR